MLRDGQSTKYWMKTSPDHRCTAPNAAYGYRFSEAMKNPAFISIGDIQNVYVPMGFTNFKN